MTPTQQPTQLTNQPSDMTSPYRGLTPYTEADAAYFFGRTAEIATITANLEVARLTLFYGPSGVGKSSVLRAGVIHELHQRAQATFASTGVAEQIPVYFNRWASDPLLGLSQTLAQTVAPYCLHPTTPHPQPTAPLLTQLQHWSEQTDSELLLVLDQFEEFFQYHTQPGGPAPSQPWDPTSFAAQLVQLVNHSALRVHLLLSLREDTLARLDYFQGRIPFLLDNRLSIGHLDRAAGEEAVVKPLARFNQEQQTAYTIEPALVTAVLEQVGSGQVTLSRQGTGTRPVEESDGAPRPLAPIEAPYLQLVLTRLWQQEQRNGSSVLRLTTLNDQLGGAAIIVRNYLDDTLAALAPADRTLAARFFDRLVTPSGAKIALTLAELTHYAGAEAEAVAALLEQLQARRLLRPTPAPNGVIQYEIFHDVLGPALLDWQARYLAEQAEAQRLAEEQAARSDAENQARLAEERTALEEAARNAAEKLAWTQAKSAKQLRDLVFGLTTLLFLAIAATTFAARQNRLITGFSLTLEARNFVREQNLRMATLLSLEARRLNSTQSDRMLGDEIPLQISYIYAKSLQGHRSAVTSVVWQPNGHLLASASDDNTVIIWDAATGERVRTLRGHSGYVTSVAWRPDGQQLASASWDNKVIIWDTTSGKPVRTLRGHTAAVWSVAWRSDGQQLASASDDNIVIIWDAATGRRVRTLHGHSVSIYSVAWRPDGQQLASASGDNTAIIWDVTSGKPVRTLWGHTAAVWSVAWRPDGQQLASASWDNTMIIWDAVSGEPVRTLHGHKAAVTGIAWRTGGQQLASASDDNTVIIWDVDRGERVHTLQSHSVAVWSVAWRPDGQQLASASDDKTVMIWDVVSSKRVRTVQGHSAAVKGIAWRPDGQQLASASSDKTLIIWDIESSKRARTLRGHSAAVTGVAWRPDRQQLASASSDKTVNIWDVASGELVHTLRSHSAAVASVGWRPDGQQLASASDDKTVIIWDATSGERIHTLHGHSAAVWSVAWRPDGQQLISASSDQTMVIWDAASGERVRTLQGRSAAVTSVAWRPDGQQLASASWDKTVIIWDMASGEQVRTLQGHNAAVTSVAWRPDGQQLASTSDDNTFLLYPSIYLAPPCTWVWSNLTPEEWLRYRGWTIYRSTCSAYPVPTLPRVVESLNNRPEFLLISWRGRLFLGALFLLGLLIMALPI